VSMAEPRTAWPARGSRASRSCSRGADRPHRDEAASSWSGSGPGSPGPCHGRRTTWWWGSAGRAGAARLACRR
jgi:hypothetical protein